VECEIDRRQVVESEEVGEQLAREHDAAGTEEGELRHALILKESEHYAQSIDHIDAQMII
jgi:hypothetical protein